MASRRGHNEGSIFRRESDGKWVGMVDCGFVDGKRKRKTVYGKTKKEVAEQLKVLLRDQQLGLPVAVERQTVKQFSDRWLADRVPPTLRAKTYRSYEQIMRCHIIPRLGQIQLTQLSPQQVQTLLKQKQQEGLSPRTVAYIRAVLRQVLNQALNWELVSRNVAKLVAPPKMTTHTVTPLTQQQAARLLEIARGDRHEALYRLALSLGMRQGELLGLRWQDIDWATSTLHVSMALQAVGGKLFLAEPKTKSSRRPLPMPATLAKALQAHRVRQLEERLRRGAAWQEHDLVFCTSVGTPIHPRNLVRSFHVLRAKADVPHLRFHDLRHSCLSLLAAQGVPARVAMAIAGHTDIKLTLNVYTHVYDEGMQQAANVMDALFPLNDEPPTEAPYAASGD